MTLTAGPGLHEGRLRAMLDPDSLADWGLNDEDRAAVRWALDSLDRLKAERDEVRAELAHSHWRVVRIQGAVRELHEKAGQMLETSRKA